jgi:uncharacterized protein
MHAMVTLSRRIRKVPLAKWLTREAGEDEVNRMIAFTTTRRRDRSRPSRSAIRGGLCAPYRMATTDAIGGRNRLRYGAEVLTCDRHLENLPRMHYLR